MPDIAQEVHSPPQGGLVPPEEFLDNDDSEEAFRYPSDNEEEVSRGPAAPESDDEEFTYSAAAEGILPPKPERVSSPIASPPPAVEVESPRPASPAKAHQDARQLSEHQLSPSPERGRPPAHATSAQLEALYDAGLSGDLSRVRALLEAATSSGDFETFALVNDASPRTGLTVVHAAASRGHINLLKWCT